MDDRIEAALRLTQMQIDQGGRSVADAFEAALYALKRLDNLMPATQPTPQPASKGVPVWRKARSMKDTDGRCYLGIYRTDDSPSVVRCVAGAWVWASTNEPVFEANKLFVLDLNGFCPEVCE